MQTNGSHIRRFNTLGRARSFADNAVEPKKIILGDDDLFWVVSLADAMRLVRQGYELAN